MSDPLLFAYIDLRSRARSLVERARSDERGEGVISAAIAVLVMAFLGVAMWLAFKGMFEGTNKRTTDQIDKIGG